MIVETQHGPYQVAGLERFAIAGDVEAEVRAAVEKHAQIHGQPPQAVTWDDAVLDLRPSNLRFNMQRIFIPPRDPFIARILDAQGRAALRVASADSAAADVNLLLASMAADETAEIAHAPGLLRFIGWPEAAPLLQAPAPRPSRQAASIGIVINYRDKSDTTIACLKQIRAQRYRAALEIVLVNNRSQATEQRAVIEAASLLFRDESRAVIRHLDYDGEFNHSDQCNRAVEMTGSEALVMMSNDCLLLGPDVIQTIADWSLEPGIGLVGPRLVGDGGTVTSAGIMLAPAERNGRPGWRLQDAEVDYLSRLVRQSCGASFACAAVARSNWITMGAADAQAFPIDYNDADFALRLSAAGYQHLYIGSCQAYHQPGRSEERSRANSNAIHDLLDARHSLDNVERSSPYTVPLKRMPAFNNASANQIGDLVRIYRLAVNSRTAETPGPVAVGLVRAFESLIAEVGGRCDLQSLSNSGEFSAARRMALVEKLRQVCAAYLEVAPAADVPERYVRSFQGGTEAFERLAAMASHRPMPEGMASAAGEDAPSAYALFTFSDMRAARSRLLVFADKLGPAQQIAFIEGLKRGRGDGSIAVRVVTEADLANMDDAKCERLRQSLRGFMPTACIFSHFGDRTAYAAIAKVLAEAAFDDTARIFHAAEDVFAPSLLLGAEAYRRARHPDRIYTLHRIVRSADLILAATPELGVRLAERFGRAKIATQAVAIGGEPFPPPNPGALRVGIAASDMKFLAPVLERLAADNPGLVIEHIGDEALLNDWAGLCQALRARRWAIGLAPERDDSKPPFLWAAYAQAGIATLGAVCASHRSLAAYGALSLTGQDDWSTSLQDLLNRPGRRQSIVRSANRLLETRYSWDQVEDATLALLDRAMGARTMNLTMANLRQSRR